MVAEQGEQAGLMRVRSYTSLDKATIIGLLGGMLALFFAILLGGSPGSFVDVPSVLLVIVGTICLTIACYSFAQLRGANRAVRSTIRRTSLRSSQVATQLVNLCEVVRQGGVLQLQSKLEVYRDQEFLYHGTEMLVDATPADDLERILRLDAESRQDQQKHAIGVLKKAAELAPAMGLIGTLVGLVQMLANLEDPSTIGPSMAVALLTTFYGACLANMVFTPLATKMEGNSDKDKLLYELYVQGLVAVARQESPRRLEMLLNTVLPENMKISYFDD